MTKPIPEMSPKGIALFWAKVDVRGADECWPWLAYRAGKGYGAFGISRGIYLAHRVALALDGRDAGEMVARHKCDNPPCCNPSHLEHGTVADNTRDMMERGRDRHPRGDEHGCAKLAVSDIHVIRADPRTCRAIAAEYGVSFSQVSRIKNREVWAHIP